MTDELNEMIRGFVEESHEAFDDIENDLLAIESNPDDINIVNSVFRVMHTIKGTAGFLNLDDISNLSHKIESIFDMIRRQELSISADLMDTILPAIDLLKLMVFELIDENTSEYNLDATLKTLENIAQMEVQSEAPVATPPPALETAGTAESEELEEDDLSAISPELRKDFVVEAEEHLEAIEQNLLNLEKNPEDENSINEVFRAIHSIKGTSDYVNLKKITRLSHGLETVFDKIRKGQQKYETNLADVVLKGTDVLRTLVFMLKIGDESTQIRIDEILDQLKLFVPPAPERKSDLPVPAEEPVLDDDTSASSSAEEKNVSAEAELVEEDENSDEYAGVYNAFNNNCSQLLPVIQHIGSGLDPEGDNSDDLEIMNRSLKTLGESAQKIKIPSIASICSGMRELIRYHLDHKLDTKGLTASLADLTGRLSNEIKVMQSGGKAKFKAFINASQEVAIELPDGNAPVAAGSVSPLGSTTTEAPMKPNLPEESGIKTMRVDSDRLDTFMNLIGEIIIARNTFSHLLGELSIKNMPPDTYKGLKAVENQFSRISEDMQVTLMEMRLIPVKTVFQKIPRIVRDISRKRHKKIQLQMIGEDVEIDKSIIEMIGDPLVHIVRNSCDHGIETTEERLQAGKQETGNIILKASHLGAEIAIDIIDDGAGINTERVLDKAIERGLVSPEEVHKLDKKTINNFIFHPGFSTAEQVTDISGRGVGMDVVSANVKKIHGSVTVDSEEGEGTQIRLLLPLTLAVVDALLIQDHGQKFAIPLEAVKETIEVREAELQKLKQKEAITLRGDIIGISRLSNLLERQPEPFDPDKVVSVVFLSVGSRVIGLIVDDLAKQQEIVVKPLQKHLANIPGISGSTILGNGEIILILDPPELIDLAAR